MLLALLSFQITLALANPLHKCPYVFLLDVGNEELEKVNTEQIRISKEGGSLALRYPAIGNGEDIAHVRVSGIDFGTDLKASIVDGGPGHKYVVLVLMGNPGVSFDATITIQTVPEDNDVDGSLQNLGSRSNDQVSIDSDANDSSEDLRDSAENRQVGDINENAEITQESSKVYNYAQNHAWRGYGDSEQDDDDNVDDDDDDDNNANVTDNENNDNQLSNEESYRHLNENQHIYPPYDENTMSYEGNMKVYRGNSIYSYETNMEAEDYRDSDRPSTLSVDSGRSEKYSTNYNNAPVDEDQYTADENQSAQEDRILHDHYESPSNYENEYINAQGIRPNNPGTAYVDEPGENESHVNLDDVFSDDYDESDNRRYIDTNNNNFIEMNDEAAVAYK